MGRVVHFEIHAGDMDRAERFYTGVFGWEVRRWEDSPVDYRLLITGGPIDERLAEGVVELTLRGFAPNRTRARAGATPKKGTGG